MQDTRQQILEILKRRKEVTVQELSRELKLTSVTVRHHLEILRSEGFITEPEVRRSSSPGRPRYVYRLTSTAADLFPNNYSGLACALLDTLEKQFSPIEQDSVLTETAQRLAAEAGNLPVNHEDRLHGVIAFLNRHGFVARWEKTKEEQFLIHISSCPYHYVTQTHPQTCQIDQRMIAELTGGELHRVEGYAYQDAVCTYQVSWPT
ncbi:MAG: ArsR family transcriptional regulator [Anaerolineae bacterium]|nr:ArsR family transcriptional regulator [Anaerolineae bacterium]